MGQPLAGWHCQGTYSRIILKLLHGKSKFCTESHDMTQVVGNLPKKSRHTPTHHCLLMAEKPQRHSTPLTKPIISMPLEKHDFFRAVSPISLNSFQVFLLHPLILEHINSFIWSYPGKCFSLCPQCIQLRLI